MNKGDTVAFLDSKKRNPLITKALAHKSKTGPVPRVWTEDEIDVFVWWLYGELDQAQAAKALEIKGVHVAPFAARAIKQGIESGRIGVRWIPKKPAP